MIRRLLADENAQVESAAVKTVVYCGSKLFRAEVADQAVPLFLDASCGAAGGSRSELIFEVHTVSELK